MAESTAPSILVVDDETDLVKLFTLALKNLPYRILSATSGDRALAVLQEEIPILILLDIAMPPPNGTELLHLLRKDPRFDATKIVMLTAVPSRIGEEDSHLVDLVVAKPVT